MLREIQPNSRSTLRVEKELVRYPVVTASSLSVLQVPLRTEYQNLLGPVLRHVRDRGPEVLLGLLENLVGRVDGLRLLEALRELLFEQATVDRDLAGIEEDWLAVSEQLESLLDQFSPESSSEDR